MATTKPANDNQWVLLSYRLPREPSTPRITVWRKLKRLGVAVLGDGLVALPLDARTREHLEWIADEIHDANGSATVWVAQPTSQRDHQALANQLNAERAKEYETLTAEATIAAPVSRRTVERLRRELRRINRRDYFAPPQRDVAKAAVAALRRSLSELERVTS